MFVLWFNILFWSVIFIDFILLRIRIKKLISLLTLKKHMKVKVKLGYSKLCWVCGCGEIGIEIYCKWQKYWKIKKDRKLIQSFFILIDLKIFYHMRIFIDNEMNICMHIANISKIIKPILISFLIFILIIYYSFSFDSSSSYFFFFFL